MAIGPPVPADILCTPMSTKSRSMSLNVKGLNAPQCSKRQRRNSIALARWHFGIIVLSRTATVSRNLRLAAGIVVVSTVSREIACSGSDIPPSTAPVIQPTSALPPPAAQGCAHPASRRRPPPDIFKINQFDPATGRPTPKRKIQKSGF
ncbi:hypothetical protein ARMSODRAFT_1019548 [Armillaria solidipes]|uniref:Uncharacterized protein n=1 Tax=Armillaria solidipes TaxID=1076256 RepID=A0A2H3BFF1_9AGAR|nr:hypothetical protein ARMSODRAFT_1019548 [Armillaria solidipes]